MPLEVYEAALTSVADVIDKNGGVDGHFVGDTVSFGDLVVAAFLMWIRGGVPAGDFEQIVALNGGRWRKLLELVAK